MTHIPARTLLIALAAGSLLGTTYALSPLTLWFALASIGLVAWAVKGLEGRERRWVIGLLTIAILARVLVIAALFFAHDPKQQYWFSFFFDGDGAAMKARSLNIRAFLMGGSLDPIAAVRAFDGSYGWSSYLYVLAYLQYLVGPAPYGVHLFNVALFVAGTVLLYRFVRGRYGRLAALLGLALLLFLPTWFLWSVSALKESLQFVLMAATVVAALSAIERIPWPDGRTPWTRRIAAVCVSIVSLLALKTIRTGVLELAVATVALGAAGAFVVRRRYLVILCPLVLVTGGWYAVRQESVQSRIMSELVHAATLHIGHINTEGHTFRTLDTRFYAEPSYASDLLSTLTPPEALRFTIRSLASFVVVPLPWDLVSLSEIVFMPTQLVWYGVFILACTGLAQGFRRNALVTSALAAHFLVGAAIVSLNSGNIGTLVRHRDMVVPFVVWLAALGVVSMLVRLAARSRRGPEAPPAFAAVRPTVAREPGPMAAAVRSSVVVRALRVAARDSRLCAAASALMSTRNRGIDRGIRGDEEAMAIGELDRLMDGSGLVRLIDRSLSRGRAAWDEAAVTHAGRIAIGVLPMAERVRVLGCAAAVAIGCHALVVGLASTAAIAFPWRMYGVVLALAAICIAGCERVAASWRDWRRSVSFDPASVGTGIAHGMDAELRELGTRAIH